MLALSIFLGLLLLIAGFLCVPVVLDAAYHDKFTARVRWLFWTWPLVPKPEKKKKKKPKKEKKKTEDKPEDEKKEDNGPKEPGVLQRFYQYRGIGGFTELLGRTVRALRQFGRLVCFSLTIRYFRLYLVVVKGDDPHALAEAYGKTCAAVFPSLSWLSTHMRLRRSRINIHPDFTGWEGKQLVCETEVSMIPLVLLAALLLLVLRLAVRVVLRFFLGARKPKPSAPAQPSDLPPSKAGETDTNQIPNEERIA
ncbi:MAG: hypothetical protein LBJ11_02460 [Oscillospiraceae bacterium]|nr:hypothetical protein [Oscillospiraceae bacterium]